MGDPRSVMAHYVAKDLRAKELFEREEKKLRIKEQ